MCNVNAITVTGCRTRRTQANQLQHYPTHTGAPTVSLPHARSRTNCIITPRTHAYQPYHYPTHTVEPTASLPHAHRRTNRITTPCTQSHQLYHYPTHTVVPTVSLSHAHSCTICTTTISHTIYQATPYSPSLSARLKQEVVQGQVPRSLQLHHLHPDYVVQIPRHKSTFNV